MANILHAVLSPAVTILGFLLGTLLEWASRFFYVNMIIYNQVWEDPRCDLQALQLKSDDKVLMITSAGDHALEHAALGVTHVYSIDRNPCQNALLELKIVAIKELDYDTFWRMFGLGYCENFTRDVYPKLRKHLSPSAQKFWDSKSNYFDGGWIRKTFYWRGCAGILGFLIKLYFLAIPGLNRATHELFNAKTLEEQKRIYFSRVQAKLWNPIMKKAVESSASLSWMGVPAAQQKLLDGVEANVGMFMKKSLEYALTELPIIDNYHWRVYFTGSYTREICPEYLKEANFAKLKGGLVNNISLHTCTITEFLKDYPQKDISKFILLDHMDWMSDKPEILSEEWAEILSHATPNAQFLWRSAAKETDFVFNTRVKVNGENKTLGDVIVPNRKLAEKLHKEDRVHTYTSFYVANLKSQE